MIPCVFVAPQFINGRIQFEMWHDNGEKSRKKSLTSAEAFQMLKGSPFITELVFQFSFLQSSHNDRFRMTKKKREIPTEKTGREIVCNMALFETDESVLALALSAIAAAAAVEWLSSSRVNFEIII